MPASGGCVPSPRKLSVASAEDRLREVDGREDGQRREDVREHVADHDPEVAGAERPRRLDEREADHLEHRGADHAREGRRVDDADARSSRSVRDGPSRPAIRMASIEQREREHDVDDAHQHEVGEAAVVAGDAPDRCPTHEAIETAIAPT